MFLILAFNPDDEKSEDEGDNDTTLTPVAESKFRLSINNW